MKAYKLKIHKKITINYQKKEGLKIKILPIIKYILICIIKIIALIK